MAYARNWLKDARRFPKDAAIDFALLLFVVLMLLGFQFQLVTQAAEKFGGTFQKILSALPFAGAALALMFARTNPLHVRRSPGGRWLDSLPISEHTRKNWAVRQACYMSLLISALLTVLLIDVTLLENPALRVKPLTLALLWMLPLCVVWVRGMVQNKALLAPTEQTQEVIGVSRGNRMREFVLERPRNLITRGLANIAFAHASPLKMWLMVIAVFVTSIGSIASALTANQPQLLLLGMLTVLFLVNAAVQPEFETLFRMSRSLPLTFRTLLKSNVKWNVLMPLLFAVPFVPAALFFADGLYWAFAALLTLMGLSVLLLLKTLIALAFPQSVMMQTMFSLAAALGIGVFAMQAPLVAPLIGVVLCVVWLAERGWGLWEYGYGERER